jgi:aspartate aminotransferase
VYSELVYEPYRHFSISAIEGMKARTFLVDSFSKTFGMTGWRLGSLALPKDYVKDVLKIIQHSIYCVPPFIQSAAEEAMNMLPDIISDIRNGFRTKVEYARNKLNALPGFSCPEPKATFYLFPHIQGDDKKLSMELLEKLNIAVLPGSAFGSNGKGYIRFSITCSMKLLEKAMFLLQEYYSRERT